MAAKNTKMSWTDDKISTLKKMWKDGESAADIAKALGRNVTRNAVIGKAHRLGLSGRTKTTKKKTTEKKTTTKTKSTTKKTPAKTKEKASPKKTAVKASSSAGKKAAAVEAGRKKTKAIIEEAAAAVIAKEAVPEGGGISLLELTERTCRWPIGDPREDDFTFCGLAIHPGTPYCPEHAPQAYQASSRRGAAKSTADVEVDDDEDDDDLVDDEDDTLEVDDED